LAAAWLGVSSITKIRRKAGYRSAISLPKEPHDPSRNRAAFIGHIPGRTDSV
jgi:hypothetical protein